MGNRFQRLVRRSLFVIGSFFASGIGSVSMSTEITSPAVVNSDNTPLVLLNQTGMTPYQWSIAGFELNYYVRDQTAGTTPFVIEAGAPADTLRVNANGHIGIGAFSASANLHIQTDEIYPSIRLQSVHQDAFHTWELEGSNEGFKLIDVDNLDAVPLSILPGAPNNSVVVTSSGNVGFGISNPTAALHISKVPQSSTAETLARFGVADDPIGSLVINNNSAGDGTFIPKITGRSALSNAAVVNEALISNDVGASPAIVYNAAKLAGGPLVTRPLVVYRNNSVAKVTIAANGNVIGTSFVNTSSRELKDKITDLPSEKALAALSQLNPVEFVYKDDASGDPRIGFIAEDVPELIAEPDRKSVPVMDVIALITRVVKDQQQTINDQKKSIDELRTSKDELIKRLEWLEQR